MGSINEQFKIDGKNRNAPKNWQSLSERIVYGTISNQPDVDAQKFTFTSDAAKDLFERDQKGHSLRGINTSFNVVQRDINFDLFKDRRINISEAEFIDPDFNNGISPREVIATVELKKGITTLQKELDGITWGLLDTEGKVKNSDYTTVKTAVQPIYNGTDVAIAIISLYVLQLQLQNLIEQTAEDIETFRDKITGSTNIGAKISGIIYVAVVLALRLATALIILAALVAAVIDLISVLIPPIVKNKGITLRRGMEIIFDYVGYGFVGDFDGLDGLVAFPSKVEDLSTNFFKNLIPSFSPNKKGYPASTDAGYLANGFINEVLKIFNARLDIIGENVVMRWENDPSLFLKSSFTPEIDIATESFKKNFDQIPSTRLLTFAKDDSDEYTANFFKGTSYEVFNKSVDIPFKGLEEIRFGFALGASKTSLTAFETFIVSMAKVADTIAGLLGKNPKLETRIKRDRVNVLVVSTNNHSTAKLLPITSGGNMPRNHRELLSAKVIENNYYVNRSIVRGNGQKLVLDKFQTVFNLKNREEVLNNGNFITSKGEKASIVNLKYQLFDDFAEGKITIDNDYIAKGDVKEIITEPEN